MDASRILVIQLRRIGDVVLTTPALRALRRRFPSAMLDVLVEAPGAEALRGNPDVSEVLVYEPEAPVRGLLRVRARRYDLVIDLMGNPRTALLTACSGAAVKAGPAHVFHRWAYGVKLPQSEATQYAAKEKLLMLAPLGVTETDDCMPKLSLAERRLEGNTIGLIPASRKETRRWPAEHFAQLGRLLIEKYGCEILVFWGPGERELAGRVASAIGEGARVTAETPSLFQAAVLIGKCRLIVTNCNGPKHIAVAMGVPTVTIHGSSDPAAWNPPSPRHLVARRDELPCIGCMSNDCRYALECLKDLAPRRVLEKCEALLAPLPA